MTADRLLRKAHRVVAALFLLSLVPAAVVSAQGDAQSPWVYVPLPLLVVLVITGTYMLAQPWWRAVRVRRQREEVGA